MIRKLDPHKRLSTTLDSKRAHSLTDTQSSFFVQKSTSAQAQRRQNIHIHVNLS